MTRREIDRIRLVTRHFKELQGLRTLLFAGWFLVFLGEDLLRLRSWGFAPLSLWFLSYRFLSRQLDRYYRARFGEVEHRPPRRPRLDYRITMLLVVAVSLLFLMELTRVPAWVSDRLLYVAAGTFLVGRWLQLGRPPALAHRALLGAFLLALAPLSAFIVPTWGHPAAVEGILAATLALSGLLDHRELELAMGRHREALLAEAAPTAEGER
jgi:hypothetical protein